MDAEIFARLPTGWSSIAETVLSYERKETTKIPEKVTKIPRASSNRFTDRAQKLGYKNAQLLLGEAEQQEGRGRLLPPPPFRRKRAHIY